MSESVIKADRLSKVYLNKDKTKNWALKDLSFEVNKGEILGIVGVNGSGKSTLLKILSSIIKPSSGSVLINGRVASVLDIGTGFHPDLNGLDNLKFKIDFLGLSKSEKKRLVEEIIDFSNLGIHINYPVKNYSSGMFMRLALSTYLILPYEILLLDEVFSAGDMIFQNKVNKRIKEKIQSGVSGILVSHELSVIEKNTERCLWIDGGEVKEEGKTSRLLQKYVVFSTNESATEIVLLGQVSALNIFENEILKINSVRVENSNDNGAIFSVDGFSINIDLEKKQSEEKTMLIAYISDLQGNFIHGDSPVFRKDFAKSMKKKGAYNLKIKYPSYLIAHGQYFLNLMVLNEYKLVAKLENIGIINIVQNEESKNSAYGSFNVNSRFQLNWEVS